MSSPSAQGPPALSPRSGERVAAAAPWLSAGIGLRAQHYEEILARLPAVGWFEAHSENYFAPGGLHRQRLMQIRANYELSLHGVGLSIGSTDPLDPQHLGELKRLVDEVEPMLVSEHLCWASSGGRYLNDLLPLPYTEEALEHMAARVRETQEVLGRQILIENISSYLRYKCPEVPEWEFLTALAQRSGCAVLLDINNLYVSALNHGFDPLSYLHGIPRTHVHEFHLAGHTVARIRDREIRVDTHDTHVCDEVWTLYAAAVKRFGPRPTLIEWDADIPSLATLEAEAAKANWIAEPFRAVAA